MRRAFRLPSYGSGCLAAALPVLEAVDRRCPPGPRLAAPNASALDVGPCGNVPTAGIIKRSFPTAKQGREDAVSRVAQSLLGMNENHEFTEYTEPVNFGVCHKFCRLP